MARLKDLKTVGVAGSGLMGSGIAQVAAMSGYEVLLLDVSKAQLEKAVSSMTSSLEKLVQKEKISENQKTETLKRIKITTDMKTFSTADLVVEAATENPKVKLEDRKSTR